ncbi:MAG: WecB/TagA/CpsF family glycosyltransferase [Geobacter sp.]|nr:WecB/TagA/CpsF family glycosyltransferase [Geobacter sp.]
MKRITLLGVEITPMTVADLHALIAEAVVSGTRRVIANHNLHSIYLYHHDAEMRSFYARADYAHIDGMLLVVVGKLLGYPLTRQQRVTYADWVRPLMAEAVRQKLRIYFLGSKPGVAERAAGILCQEFAGLQIATMHGYFDACSTSMENQELIRQINAWRPNLLMVGMGMPRQEQWILENMEHIQANVILPAGACFDYVAGTVPTPPRWMGRAGLEWLYRLLSEPRRLWRRYLLEPWLLLAILAVKLLKRQQPSNL